VLAAVPRTDAVAQTPLPSADQPPSERPFTLKTSIKAGLLLSRFPNTPALFRERVGAESLWRVRFEPEGRVGRAFGAAAILPSTTDPPYRFRSLDWSISSTRSLSWRHEIDRAAVAWRAARANLTMGRQAIGWGRGVLFSAVDLFAPFAPLEVDREWRRGVDALRADIELTDRSSLDLVAALGDRWDRSILAARARGYAGDVDVEAVGGRRGEDLFAGVTSSAAVGGAGLHGEAAVFHLPAPVAENEGRRLWKGVVGGSYRLPLGSGVLTFVEYHFSQFGARRPGDLTARLSSADFVTRYLRGDTQILGRHAVAVTASYEQSPELMLSSQWIQSPTDGSGIVAPALTVTLGDRLSVLLATFLPYGAPPQATTLRTEYGAAARAGFLQLRLYL
jgi:hypothetical protein